MPDILSGIFLFQILNRKLNNLMSKTNDKEILILKRMQTIDLDLNIVRSKLKAVRTKVSELETELIGLKIAQEQLTEELRKLRLASE